MTSWLAPLCLTGQPHSFLYGVEPAGSPLLVPSWIHTYVDGGALSVNITRGNLRLGGREIVK